MGSDNEAWVPLEAALIWVATRDSALFSKALLKSGPSSISSLQEDEDAGASKIDVSEAWDRLRGAIEKQDLPAKGVAYEERPANGLSQHAAERDRQEVIRSIFFREIVHTTTFPDDPDMEDEEDIEEVPVEPQPIDISTQQVISLVLDDSDAGICLRPAAWALTGGRGWVRVMLSRSRLATCFPGVAPAEVGNSGKPEQKAMMPSRNLGYLSDIVRKVIVENFPNGFPDSISAAQRNALINAKVEVAINEMVDSGKFPGVDRNNLKKTASDPVIRKVLSNLKTVSRS